MPTVELRKQSRKSPEYATVPRLAINPQVWQQTQEAGSQWAMPEALPAAVDLALDLVLDLVTALQATQVAALIT